MGWTAPPTARVEGAVEDGAAEGGALLEDDGSTDAELDGSTLVPAEGDVDAELDGSTDSPAAAARSGAA